MLELLFPGSHLSISLFILLFYRRAFFILKEFYDAQEVKLTCSTCCVRHSEAFSRVRLARCGGSRHVKLGDIKLQGDGAPQCFLSCPALSSLAGLCWGPGPSSQRGHVAGLQTDPRVGLGHQWGHLYPTLTTGSVKGAGQGRGCWGFDLWFRQSPPGSLQLPPLGHSQVWSGSVPPGEEEGNSCLFMA